MRRGYRLGVDVGTVRVGLARTDIDGMLAVPESTVPRDGAIAAIVALTGEWDFLEIVVGLPIKMDGTRGPAADAVEAFAYELSASIPVPVRMVDERLTTASAAKAMRASGVNAKKGRSRIDQAAAIEILQHALDQERATGAPAGYVIDPSR